MFFSFVFVSLVPFVSLVFLVAYLLFELLGEYNKTSRDKDGLFLRVSIQLSRRINELL